MKPSRIKPSRIEPSRINPSRIEPSRLKAPRIIPSNLHTYLLHSISTFRFCAYIFSSREFPLYTTILALRGLYLSRGYYTRSASVLWHVGGFRSDVPQVNKPML